MRLQKFEVSIFEGEEGENVDGWLHHVERYFMVNWVTKRDKLDVAILCLEGEALDWYHWKEDQMTVDNWVEFGQLLWKRFNQSRGKTCTSDEVAARELCLGISLTV